MNESNLQFCSKLSVEKEEKSENDTKIKLMPLPSNKKGVSGGNVDLIVKLNFKWGQFS